MVGALQLCLRTLARTAEGLIYDKLEALTAEPLLCYLLAISGYLDRDFKEAAENPNRIYAKLFEDVWRRGWRDPRRPQAESEGKAATSPFQPVVRNYGACRVARAMNGWRQLKDSKKR